MNKSLIYDWNRDTPVDVPPVVMLDDETLRDGLQSPSVRAPSIDQKLRILRLLDQIGVDTADIGLPGAGPHVVRDVERLAREIVDSKLKIKANCAARTVVSDVQPIVDVSQRVGLPIECCCFIGSSPIRRYAEDWTVDYLQRCTEEAVSFGVNHGLEVMYVTEDTTRSDPETLRRLFTTAIRAGASRLCIADTVGHATPAGARAVVTFAKQIVEEAGGGVGIDWHGHRDRDMGTINSLAALEAGASRVHGTMLGLGSVFDYRLRDLPKVHDRIGSLGIAGPVFELAMRRDVSFRLTLSAQYAFAVVGSIAYREAYRSVVGQDIKTSLRYSGYYYAQGLVSAATTSLDLGPIGFTGSARGAWYWSIDDGDPAQSKIDRTVTLHDSRLYLAGAMWTRPAVGGFRFGLAVEHVRRGSHMLDTSVYGTELDLLATTAVGF